MERRVRWKSHARREAGENLEIISEDYLSLYFKGGTSKILAENIEAEVKVIAQNSRGCKIRMNSSGRDYYGFIRETKCPAVICEGCFVDNATDAQIADTASEQQAFGVAYAKGILKTLGIAIKENTAQNTQQNNSNSEAKYYVQVGAYLQKENAEKQLQNAKDTGFTGAFIKQF